MSDDPQTPATEAGRAMLDRLTYQWSSRENVDGLADILAIEAEASAAGIAAGARQVVAARAEARASLDVDVLARMTDFWPNDGDHRWCDEDSGGGHRFDSDAWAADFAREYRAILAEKVPE